MFCDKLLHSKAPFHFIFLKRWPQSKLMLLLTSSSNTIASLFFCIYSHVTNISVCFHFLELDMWCIKTRQKKASRWHIKRWTKRQIINFRSDRDRNFNFIVNKGFWRLLKALEGSLWLLSIDGIFWIFVADKDPKRDWQLLIALNSS